MSDTTNFYSFQLEWEKLASKTGASVGEVVRKISLDLWTEITQRTPVDTGRARANWIPSVGAPSQEVHLYPGAKAGSIPQPSAPDFSEVDGTQDVYLTNNLPYIEALEEGHSQQAPSGMVGLAMESVQARAEAFLK